IVGWRTSGRVRADREPETVRVFGNTSGICWKSGALPIPVGFGARVINTKRTKFCGACAVVLLQIHVEPHGKISAEILAVRIDVDTGSRRTAGGREIVFVNGHLQEGRGAIWCRRNSAA